MSFVVKSKVNMVFTRVISPEIRAQARLYYEESRLTVSEIATKLYISRSSLYRLLESNNNKNTEERY